MYEYIRGCGKYIVAQLRNITWHKKDTRRENMASD